MARRTTLFVLLAGGARAAEPECSTHMSSLGYNFADGQYGDQFYYMMSYRSEAGSKRTTDYEFDGDVMCNQDNWDGFMTATFAQCPLQLVVTEPAEYAFSVCLEDNFFAYNPAGHISAAHPHANKEKNIMMAKTPFETAPDGSKPYTGGCNDKDFEHDDFTDAIVVGQADCWWFLAGLAAGDGGWGPFQDNKGSGASVYLPMQTPETYAGTGGYAMHGAPISMPVIGLPGAYYGKIMALLQDGVKLKGRIDFNCDRTDVMNKAPNVDYCPEPKLVGKCADQQDESRRLCERCPQEFTAHGTSFCLHGNQMLPFKAETWLNGGQQDTATPQELTYVELAGSGCTEAEFAGLSGKHIIVAKPSKRTRPRGPENTVCFVYESLSFAQKAGVAGYTTLSAEAAEAMAYAWGPSKFIDIPTHAILPSQTKTVKDLFKSKGSKTTGAGWEAWTLSGEVARGAPSAQPPAPPKGFVAENRTLEVVESTGFEWTAGAVVALLFTIVFFAASVGKLAHSHMSSVKLGAGGIPLNAASMSLSVSLLLIIGMVAFALTSAAGQRAVDQVSENGEAETTATFESAKRDVEDLSQKVSKGAAQNAKTAVMELLNDLGDQVNQVTQMYRDTDASFDSWVTVHNAFVDAARAHHSSGLYMASKNAFYADEDFVTLAGTGVSVDNDGAAYPIYLANVEAIAKPVNMSYRDLRDFRVYPADSIAFPPNAELGPLNRQGTVWFGDAHEHTTGKQSGYRQWYVPDRAHETYLGHLGGGISATVMMPVHNRGGEFLGTAGGRVELDKVKQYIEKFITQGNEMKLLVFDEASDMIITSTSEGTSSAFAYTGEMGGANFFAFRRAYTSRQLADIPSSAMMNWLRSRGSRGADGAFAGGSFDQKEYYEQRPYLNSLFAVSGSQPRDIGPHNYESLWTGGSPVSDATYGNVMKFDGASSLQIYKEMMPSNPIVASTNGAFPLHRRHSWPHDPSGSRECVASEDLLQGGWLCMLRDPYLPSEFTMFVRVNPDEDIPATALGSSGPQVFSHTESGETTMRLYANGKATFNIVDYGCQTAPIAGGLKKGQWTSIALVWDGKFCKTYINGVHHSSGQASKLITTVDSLSPGFVGQNYKGLMHHLSVFNTTLSDAEMANMHMLDDLTKFQRVVESRTWLAEFASLDMNGAKSAGLRWGIAAMLPQDVVLKEVIARNIISQEALRLSKEKSNNQLAQENAETVLVVLAIMFASVLLFLVFNDMLTQPFATVAVVMAEAAVLKIDEIPNLGSVIKEMNAMQHSMTLMLENLKMYKSYMPQSIVADDDDDDEEMDESVSKSETAAATRKKSAASSHISASASHRSCVAAEGAQGKRALMTLSLTKKRLTFGVLNVQRWGEMTSAMSEHSVIKLHCDLLTTIMQTFSTFKGIMEPFSGDRFACSFNAAKACGTHKASACGALTCAVGLLEKAHSAVAFSGAISTGEGKCGNIGNDQMKRFSMFSSAVTLCYALERFSSSVPAGIFVDKWVHADSKTEYNYRTAWKVLFTKRCKNAFLVHELMGKKSDEDNDEWMYQLESAEAADKYKPWNDWVERIVEGESGEAATLLEKAAGVDTSSALFVKLKEAMSTFVPTELALH